MKPRGKVDRFPIFLLEESNLGDHDAMSPCGR
jgi:hypothetical protein